jgi:hypothetical protein
VHARAAGAVLVKEVPRKKNEVDLLLPRNLENLSEGINRVLAANGVLFSISDVVVGREQDAETTERVEKTM